MNSSQCLPFFFFFYFILNPNSWPLLAIGLWTEWKEPLHIRLALKRPKSKPNSILPEPCEAYTGLTWGQMSLIQDRIKAFRHLMDQILINGGLCPVRLLWAGWQHILNKNILKLNSHFDVNFQFFLHKSGFQIGIWILTGMSGTLIFFFFFIDDLPNGWLICLFKPKWTQIGLTQPIQQPTNL